MAHDGADVGADQRLLEQIIDKLVGKIGDEPDPSEREPLRERTAEETEKELMFLCEYLVADKIVNYDHTKKWTSQAGKSLLLYAIYGERPLKDRDYPWTKLELGHVQKMMERAATQCQHLVPIMFPMYQEFREHVLQRDEESLRRQSRNNFSAL